MPYLRDSLCICAETLRFVNLTTIKRWFSHEMRILDAISTFLEHDFHDFNAENKYWRYVIEQIICATVCICAETLRFVSLATIKLWFSSRDAEFRRDFIFFRA